MGEGQRPLIGTLDSAKDWLAKKRQEMQATTPADTQTPYAEDAAEELSEDDLIDVDTLSDIDEVETNAIGNSGKN